MDVSCVWFCRSRLRSFTGQALVGLTCIAMATVFLQSLYLHTTIGETLRVILPAREKHRLMHGKLHRTLRSESETHGGFIYQTCGRAQAVIRFALDQNGYQYKKHGKEEKFRLFSHPELFNSFYNGNISIHNPNPLSYLKASNNNMYIVSAFDRGRYSFKMSNISWFNESYNNASIHNATMIDNNALIHNATMVDNNIVMTGWLSMHKMNMSLLCCLLDNNNTVIQYQSPKRIIWTQVKKQELLAAKMFCPLPDGMVRESVIGSSVTALVEHCNKKTFVAIENAEKASGESIALCSKIAYGTLSAQRLLEWLEIQRYIGVDKILIYVYNLNAEAMSVLRFYTQDGLVDIVPFDVPKAEEIKRHVGQKEAQPFIDEQVVVFDCMERLRGYTYIGVMDVDEVIFSRVSPRRNLKHLMRRLMRRQPNAGGFRFRTELFITEWVTENLTSTEQLFWHSRHQNRTRPIVDRTKNLIATDRVVLASVWTHNYTVKPGFEKYNVPASVATLKHYRPCRENWHCNMRRGYRDVSIASVVNEIKDSLLSKISALNLTPAAP